MFARICTFLVLLIALPAFCQVAPEAEGGATTQDEDTQMMTPPPVTGLTYPNVAGSDERSNYLSAGVTGNVGYIDNVLPNEFVSPVSDYTYVVAPTVSFDRTSPRQHTTFIYSPSFAFYQPTSALNSVDHSASVSFQERLSPHLAFNAQDSFLRTSDVFTSSNTFAGAVPGSVQTPVSIVIAPYEEQMSDNLNGALSYQTGPNSMIGGGGSYLYFNYPNSTQSQGLYSSTGETGSAFYDRRFDRTQYVGLSYQYQLSSVNLTAQQVQTQTQTVLPFYTVYFNRSFSLSVSAGVQNVNVTQTGQMASSSWSPTGTASLGWQGNRGTFAASYLRVVTAGSGFGGAYKSNTVNASAGWKLTNTWNLGGSVAYGTASPAATLVGLPYQGGNSFTAAATLRHSFGQHLTAEVGYDRLQQNYTGIAVINASPNSDREYGTVTYTFRKPLGR